jgi:glycosyltransferase involved in cell wall biosynthesis
MRADREAEPSRQTDEELRDIAAELKPDIVHVNGYAHAAAGFDVPVVVAAHSCVPSWWRACHGEAAPAEWDPYRARLARGLAAAAAVITPTEAFLAAFVAENGPVRGGKAIHNGRDPARFAAGDKQPVAISAGRAWDGAKNIAALDEAAPLHASPDRGRRRHRRRHVPAHLPRWPARSGRPRGAHVGRGRLRLAGALRAVRPRRARSGAVGLRARPLAIATFRELWEGAALFVDPTDPRALANALDELLADPVRAHRSGDAARRRASRYTAAAMANSTLRLWRAVLAARGAGRTPSPVGRAA